uniref:Nucleolar GTP-binding protein 2 n=1 Tax=Dermatophagoides pteronyssinus TaxID=6956 RepID=A0A6P6YA25_DERPT|nr:nucleolar GTP-binding protein 2-like [Dermatophagoides pteronyssinus]
MSISKRKERLQNVGRRKDENAVKVHHGSEKASNFGRTKSVSNIVKLYKDKGVLRTKLQPHEAPVVRIEPSRKWFNNTRVVSQEKLEKYRQTLENHKDDPMSVMVKRTKLPVSLFDHSNESDNKKSKNLLALQSFSSTFSSKTRQKQPLLGFSSLADLSSKAEEESTKYLDKLSNQTEEDLGKKDGPKPQPDAILSKGTSKNLWGELYKVVDSSDVVLEVLDARDPMGTRCYYLEQHIKKDRPFKHIVLVLNKCDLVSESVTRKWVKILSKEFPTLAFKASIKHSFGKYSLIALLRQYAKMLSNRKHVSVGLIGFPNVGKSSLINTLRSKQVCNVAPIPGETKTWQYIELSNRIYIIDCPGIVHGIGQSTLTDNQKVIRGVVRAEKLLEPEQYIQDIVDLVGYEKFVKHYNLDVKLDEPNKSSEELLTLMAIKRGKLGKGQVPLISQMAVKVIYDIQRGKLPYFVPPPSQKEETSDKNIEHLSGIDLLFDCANVAVDTNIENGLQENKIDDVPQIETFKNGTLKETSSNETVDFSIDSDTIAATK